MADRIVYLHGFASGPTSRKARFFSERLAQAGRAMETPDLTAGDFKNLTISGQIAVIEKVLEGAPAILIGSSLGGYLAALYASLHAEVKRLVLLAPAFGFTEYWKQTLSVQAMEEWRATDALKVYHYGEQRMRHLGFGIVEDSQRWPAAPAFTQPGHIFHGIHDTVVPPRISEDYVRLHRHVRLTPVDSDHELGSALDEIWHACRGDLLLP